MGPILGLQAYFKIKAVTEIHNGTGRCQGQAVTAGTWIADKESQFAVLILELADHALTLFLFGVPVICAYGCHAVGFLQRQLNRIDIVAIACPDNDLA